MFWHEGAPRACVLSVCVRNHLVKLCPTIMGGGGGGLQPSEPPPPFYTTALTIIALLLAVANNNSNYNTTIAKHKSHVCNVDNIMIYYTYLHFLLLYFLSGFLYLVMVHLQIQLGS